MSDSQLEMRALMPSEEDVACYQRNGYYVSKKILSDEMIAAATEAVSASIAVNTTSPSRGATTRASIRTSACPSRIAAAAVPMAMLRFTASGSATWPVCRSSRRSRPR